MADRSFLRTRLAPVLCLLAAAIGCPDDKVATTALPGGVDVAALLPEHRDLLRVTLAIDGGARAETDLELSSDQTLSGTFDVENVEVVVERTMTLRIYGRFSATSEEVLLGRLEKPITLQPEVDVTIAFGASDTFNTCDGEPGACAVLFDANRNGLSNIEDLLERARSAGRGIDPAPQAPYLVTSSEQLQFPSGVRLGTFSRQLVVLENFGSNPVTVKEASVVGGQGFSISILDPTGQSVAPPGRALAGDAFRTIAPGQEAFVAVSFTPVNSFVTTGALFVRVRDEVTFVEQTARVKLIANPEGELRPADPVYVEPDLGTVGVDGGSLPVVAFPNAQLQSGDALIAEDALGAGLRQSGATLTLVDGAASVAFPADAAFAVDVRAGERFSTAIDGLTSDVDIAVLEIDATGAVLGLACPDCRSANAGTSPEAVEFRNDGAARRVIVVLGRIEPESDEPENEGALTVAETVSFRCSTTVSFGPEFAAIDPVLPTTGPLEGGIAVTLRGSGFDPRARVLVGQAEALDVAISRDDAGNDTVTFTLPAAVGVENPASIIVENPTDGGDGQAATLLESFSYQPPAPVVDEIRPDVAPTTGGTTPVTIIGRFFSARQGVPQVAFGTVTVDATFVSASELTVTPPAHIDPLTSATVSVKVRNRLVADDGATVSLGSASNGVAFRYLVPAGAAPTLTAIAPATGSVDGNTRVTLSGTDFRTGAQVFFGARSATCDTPSSTTSMSCFTPPADAPGAVDIIVVNADGQSAKLDAGYAYEIPSPTISSVFPPRGITDGGTLLVVEGGGFRPGARVTFVQGETTRAATAATRVSGTTMLVTTPAGTSGTARLVITNLDTQDVEADFTYFAPDAATPPPAITAINPAVGDAAGGFPVTVTGTGFLAPAVVFGSTNVQVATFIDRDPPELDEVTVVAPPSPTGVAAAVTVQIINDDGQSATNGFNYTFSAAAPPRIDRVDPSTFVAGQTTPFTISGARFDAGARVTVGGLQASLQSVSSTTIRATLSGQLAPGTVMVVVENPNGGAVAAPVNVTAPVVVGAPIVTNVSTTDVHANVAGDVITIFGDNLDQGALEVLTSAVGQGALATAPRILTRGKNVIVLELPALESTTLSTPHTLSLRFSGAGVTTLTVPLVAHRPVVFFGESIGEDTREGDAAGPRELVIFGEFLNPAALESLEFVSGTSSVPCTITTASERTIACNLEVLVLDPGQVFSPIFTWRGSFGGVPQNPAVIVAGNTIGFNEELAGPPLQVESATPVRGLTDYAVLPQTTVVTIPGFDPAQYATPPTFRTFDGIIGALILAPGEVTVQLTSGVAQGIDLSFELVVGTARVVQGSIPVLPRTIGGGLGQPPSVFQWPAGGTFSGRNLLAGDDTRVVARRQPTGSGVDLTPLIIPVTATRFLGNVNVTSTRALPPGNWAFCFSDQVAFCNSSQGFLFVSGVSEEVLDGEENGIAVPGFVSGTLDPDEDERYFFLLDEPGVLPFNLQCPLGVTATLQTRAGATVADLCDGAGAYLLDEGEHVITLTNLGPLPRPFEMSPGAPQPLPFCGDGEVGFGEACDEGGLNGVSVLVFGDQQVMCNADCTEPPEPFSLNGINPARTLTLDDEDTYTFDVLARGDLSVFTTERNGVTANNQCGGTLTLTIEDALGRSLVTTSNGTGGCAFAAITVDPGTYTVRLRASFSGQVLRTQVGAFVVAATCGNGTLNNDSALGGSEQCDDANAVAGDGCDRSCRTEPGFTCFFTGLPCDPQPVQCGDGVLNPNPRVAGEAFFENVTPGGLAHNGGIGAGVAVNDAGVVFAVENTDGAITRRDPQGAVFRIVGGNSILNPNDIEVGPDGLLYVAAGSAIIRVDPDTGINEPFITGLDTPSGLAFDENGDLFVGSRSTSLISRFSLLGTFISDVGTALPVPIYDLEIGPDGNIYAVGFTGDETRVFRMTPAGQQGVFGETGDVAIDDPHSLAFDGAGNLWVSFYNGLRLVRFSPTGAATVFLTPAEEEAISGIAIDRQGSLYGLVNGGRTTGSPAIVRYRNFAVPFPEECEDSNFFAGDGCSPGCTIEPGAVCTGVGQGSCVFPGEPFVLGAFDTSTVLDLGQGGLGIGFGEPVLWVEVDAVDNVPGHISLALDADPTRVICREEFDDRARLCDVSTLTGPAAATASFLLTPSPFNGGVLYESVGFPGAFLRGVDGGLFIQEDAQNEGSFFLQSASWARQPFNP